MINPTRVFNPTRLFNPTRQSERFDPEGDFVRRYVPELRTVSEPEIHDPLPLTPVSLGYPIQIVNHAGAISLYRLRRRSTS